MNLFDKYDRRAYYLAFEAAHGQPINFENGLLFPDLWTWRPSDSYAGREYPPPVDASELQRLRRAYDTERRRLILLAIQDCESVKNEQASRSLPLWVKPADGGPSTPLNMDEVEANLQALKQELKTLSPMGTS